MRIDLIRCIICFLVVDTSEITFLIQIIHHLIECKQAEIRKVHPGLTNVTELKKPIEIKDIPGICKCFMSVVLNEVNQCLLLLQNNVHYVYTLLQTLFIILSVQFVASECDSTPCVEMIQNNPKLFSYVFPLLLHLSRTPAK